MKRVLLFVFVLIASVACKETKVLLPSVSGKAGEIVVIIEKDDWEGTLGEKTRELLTSPVPYLVQSEPMFNLINLPSKGFSKMFQVHRNVIIFQINPQIDSAGVFYRKNIWSDPQSVVQISAYDSETALNLLSDNGLNIVSYIEQAERDRIIRNARLYEQHSLVDVLAKDFGGCLHFPNSYKLRKASSDFIWIADDKQYVYQDVFVYRYPANEKNPFSAENIIRHRNEILMANVPGMFDNSYMTTSPFFAPMVESLKYKGRSFVQTRGMWEVENDYMGGPFVSHSFYSQDGQYIIVLEAFVYAPRYDKRAYLRQVESLLYSWEWKESE